MTSPHPYYPRNANIAGYIPNDIDAVTLVSIFAALCAGTFALTSAIVLKARPKIPTSELSTILWFVLCGNIHLLLEGYYVLNFLTLPQKSTLPAQLWKEYSLSDSRYLAPNGFVLMMESITAFAWGPLSFLLAYLITTNHVLRHPVQALVSLGQLYGDILYYGTSLFDYLIFGIEHSRPEAGYYWGYWVFLNAFWIVIPIALLWNSFGATAKAFRALGVAEGGRAAKKAL